MSRSFKVETWLEVNESDVRVEWFCQETSACLEFVAYTHPTEFEHPVCPACQKNMHFRRVQVRASV